MCFRTPTSSMDTSAYLLATQQEPRCLSYILHKRQVNKSKAVGSHRFASKASYRDSCVAALFRWQSEIHDNAGMHSPLPATCCFVSTGQPHHSIPSLGRSSMDRTRL
ncbi:hypothetical protein FOTG_07256 [Fusarium oxysporum f. sp. vasinfectum 25433]|uniref:Uncharacterized protein n=1 Tax=Fusarium oxysporum f. sp. vasinfectum 25433 TaxID=1089449 RepID=X0LJU1_FUSOX|nr:hypothetical protein FOTG_07256 [Fusarium oxysporum f. sp. vasinfectum 25433]